ncbi:cyclic nucleotide-gated ion channel 2-like protein [Carex littledalei]|uniref:Cyclic nucleotide-gated ion channel 2-like protein n=1 Tax=Carex littledalei TaxID=544730 RepID=A0A833VBL3_9POAL|nr:cyclic nucleotide-gated ion channel 2-like protein [Carex littledalei]
MSSPPSDLSQMLSSSTSGTVNGSSSSPLPPDSSSSTTVPQSSPTSFLSIWRRLKRNLRICTSRDDTISNFANSAGSASISECYACTRPGAPAFHSTSCEHALAQPEWEACAGSSLIPIQYNPASNTPTCNLHATSKRKHRWIFGTVLDPRSPRVQSWNRALLFARALALAADPVFFYAIGVGIKDGTCHKGLIGVVRRVVALAAVVRTGADIVHAGHIWVQLRLAFVSRESLVVGSGKLVWDPIEIARHYVKKPKGIWFDLFVLVPLPQLLRNY